MSDIEIIGSEPHEPFSNHIPAEPSAEELKLAGVTIVGEENSMLGLRCDVCSRIWCVVNWPECKERLKEPSYIKPYWQCVSALMWKKKMKKS